MMWPSSGRRLPALLLAVAILACAALSLQCGGTEDLSPRPEPRPYQIDGVEDCAALANLFLKFRSIEVEAGAHTLRLEASDYGDQLDSTYQSHFVCVVLDAGMDTTAYRDWFFTLNGIGDEKTVRYSEAGVLHVGYIGTVALGNHGSSVVSVDAVSQYQILASAHTVTAADLWERFVEVEYDSMGAGTYDLVLGQSNFSPREGIVAPLVLVHLYEPEEEARDYLITSLNGVGDHVTVHLEPDSRIFGGFIDDLAMDNTGGAKITVAFEGGP